jgi:lipopolysaccharide/colanic/teichoic acid biosynthesis glycosyltransferase
VVTGGRRILEVLYCGFERAVALVALVLASPLLLLLAIVIRLDSPGPVLFIQRRTARSRPVPGRELIDAKVPPSRAGFDPDGLYWLPQTFSFVKFRTMRVDSAERFPECYWWDHDVDTDDVQNMYYKVVDDPRLTRVGQWLRRTSLDELPNLWNVVTGDTRLIGPRPENPAIQAFYREEQMLKFSVKPGLSGPAEVYGRSELTVGERLVWDLEYVRTRSVWGDVTLLFKTIGVMLSKRGAF